MRLGRMYVGELWTKLCRAQYEFVFHDVSSMELYEKVLSIHCSSRKIIEDCPTVYSSRNVLCHSGKWNGKKKEVEPPIIYFLNCGMIFRKGARYRALSPLCNGDQGACCVMRFIPPRSSGAVVGGSFSKCTFGPCGRNFAAECLPL